ncbi:MAG: DNA replication complex subunit Gins51 [Promethearchaeota archaeon]
MDAATQERVYLKLYGLWHVSYSSSLIQTIEQKDSFFYQVGELLKELSDRNLKEKNPILKQIIQGSIENTNFMVKDILDLRANKIRKKCKNLEKINEEKLLSFELLFYRQLYSAFRGYSKSRKLIGQEIAIDEDDEPGALPTIESENNSSQFEISDSFEPNDSFSDKNAANLSKNRDEGKVEINGNTSTSAKNNPFAEDTSLSFNPSPSLDLSLNSEDPSEDELFPSEEDIIFNTDDQDAPIKNNNDFGLISPSQSPSASQSPLYSKPQNSSIPLEMESNSSSNKLDNSIKIERNIKYLPIRLLSSISAIVGYDFQIYGPFHKGDISYLPKSNAEILIEEDLAIPISISN